MLWHKWYYRVLCGNINLCFSSHTGPNTLIFWIWHHDLCFDSMSGAAALCMYIINLHLTASLLEFYLTLLSSYCVSPGTWKFLAEWQLALSNIFKPHPFVCLLLDFLRKKFKSNQTGGGRFWMFLTSSNMHIVFYLSHSSLQDFLLASACLFSWTLHNTDISLKYWIHPILRIWAACPVRRIGERERRQEIKKRGEVGSLNKLLSVYLIYRAIRGMHCGLKLNFSSCEAS